MPVPTEDPGAPTAWADGETVRIKLPVRCETGQRAGAMTYEDGRQFANRIIKACNEAERSAWLRSAEMNR